MEQIKWVFNDKLKDNCHQFSTEDIYCGYSLESLQRGDSNVTYVVGNHKNVYHNICLYGEISKIIP